MTSAKPNFPTGRDDAWREELRRRAEAAMEQQAVQVESLSPDELRELAHELLVYQIELEMQNQELRHAQAELADSRDRYLRLFDFAPVGYLTLSQDGRILNANLTMTVILKMDRKYLQDSFLNQFVSPSELDSFRLQQQKAVESGERQSFEIGMQRSDGSRFQAQIELSAAEGARDDPQLKVAVSDVTARWNAEREIRESESRLCFVIGNLPVMVVALDDRQRIIAWNAECEEVTGYKAGDIIGNPRAFTLLAPRPEDRQSLLDALADRQANFRGREIVLQDREGRQKTIAWTNRTGRSPIPGWSSWAVGIDISDEVAWRREQQNMRAELEAQVVARTQELTHTVDRLQDEIKNSQQFEASLQRANRISTKLAQIAVLLEQEMDLPRLVDTLGSELSSLTLSCAFSLLDPETSLSSYYSTVLQPADLEQIGNLLGYDLKSYHPSEPLWDLLVQRQVVTHAELVRFLAKTNPNMNERDSYQALELLGYSPETRLAILPLQSQERLIGMLWLWGADLQAADLPALRIFSGQVALSLERIRLIERLRSQQERLKNLTNRLVEVQEAERRYLALELHDEVGQDLTGLKMILAGRMESGTEARDPAIEVVDRLLEMVRDLSLRLHPPMLDQMGLLPTFLWHIERYTNLTGIRVKIAHQGVKDRRFPAVIENALYRVMQEALTNIARHAEVDFATVRLWAGDDIVELQVEDQGRGFEKQEIDTFVRGVGLSGINERVTLLGGSLDVESQPGQGTRLSVEIPIARNAPPPKEQDA